MCTGATTTARPGCACRCRIPKARRVENRVGGADANPYLAIAASLACGYLGMIENLQPSDPITGSAHDLPFALPRSLDAALRRLQESEALIRILGEPFVAAFSIVKEAEIRGVPAGDQLLGARAPAAERLSRQTAGQNDESPGRGAVPSVAGAGCGALPASVHRHASSLRERGTRVITRGEGVYLYDARRRATARWHVGPVVRGRGLRPAANWWRWRRAR